MRHWSGIRFDKLCLARASTADYLLAMDHKTKLITATESGLLGSAEVPLAIFMAWIFLAELPPLTSFIGGLIVLCAVVWHAIRDYRRAIFGGQ